jgi:glycosyltransferase involved in cell wall biosynthesis
MNVVMIGPFGMAPKQTMRRRALPLARALVARGHAVTMLLPPWSNPEAAGTQSDDDGVRIVNLRLPRHVPVVFETRVSLALARQALALRPDVIHGFKPKSYAGLAMWMLWQFRRFGLCRARLVVDGDDWESAGGWNDAERYGAVLRRFFAWQELWGLTHADGITVASRTLESLVWALGVPRARVHYVANGVRTISSSPTRSADPAQPALLLYTRFFEFGLARIASVLAEIAARDTRVRFTIAGKGLFGEETEFRQLLCGTHAEARTDWLGWVPETELPAVFARAGAALYPFDDTLLNRAKCAVKLTELLDAGVPVVAEAVGQNREYIVHGESGLLTPPGDGDAMAGAALRLLNDPELAARLGACAHARMQDQFTWDRLALHVERAYAS